MESIARNDSPPKFCIMVYNPGRWILKANVLSTATVNDILQLIPDRIVKFVHNGIELTDSFSLSMYGVKEGDVIFVLPETKNGASYTEKWASLTKDRDLFHDRVCSLIDPETAMEAARIRDLQMLRMERKPKVFRKISSVYKSDAPTKQKSKAPVNAVEPPKLNKPSAAPLPTFWATSLPVYTKPSETIPSPSLLSQENKEDVRCPELRDEF
ncbi:hypothetical protein TVAG_257440 [Trichomonas vaginalis G3]|uniref:Ubiquitin-like domain-containing protein n=1 Tax=Trichomonas vaginalis (strain ATCC PRA-98 / G3) TaxID=412133 RepID=A2ELH8_TRIV3|nr:ubiquitin-like family [Trichomonas vaginalis G3]EAY06505.1 hypothetical protein TVAG_257440 [Trichomonas vaginalis G3]KAI5538860.1 ubiquitin-like family [Trichomonas vaginalis G3]|eukprot:XP_001318728.1 hypothetical protein [Trichomonas vaginalis G3]